ncbi:exodeoxyribonuclease VII large subunit [Sulfurimonas sp. HSL3-7]|uniref:exodeoxyribonuclease VII large subunit n=1 Tax=Sulfonitrofixus jiaomeiensis TaxID=3131938 RepID=UPI0031F911B8
MQQAITVSTLNEQIKGLLESTFVRVYVEGELSRITHHNSGHIYFTLKDAGSAVSGVMFRGNASKLKFRLEEGLKVIVEGAVTVYTPRGSYQINAFNIEPAGHGALALAFEQLKAKLSAQGYFDPAIKKAMPKFPKRIALVTSATGAALQDMQRVAAQRWPLAQLFVYDTIVQGEYAAPSIVNAIQAADSQDFDIIVVSRGGGSMEDLWGFNEEIVANAIFHARTPVVSAVGHEIDWLISDFVADLRAPTPSAAMQMILPDQNELLQTIDILGQQFTQSLQQKLYSAGEKLSHLKNSYERHSIEQRIKNRLEEIAQLSARFDQSINFVTENAARKLAPVAENLARQANSNLIQNRNRLSTLLQALQAQDPKQKSRKGYAQIAKEGKVIDLSALDIGDSFEAMDSSRSVTAVVENITKF